MSIVQTCIPGRKYRYSSPPWHRETIRDSWSAVNTKSENEYLIAVIDFATFIAIAYALQTQRLSYWKKLYGDTVYQNILLGTIDRGFGPQNFKQCYNNQHKLWNPRHPQGRTIER